MKKRELQELSHEGFFAALPLDMQEKLMAAYLSVHERGDNSDWEIRTEIFISAVQIFDGAYDTDMMRVGKLDGKDVVDHFVVAVQRHSPLKEEALSCEDIARELLIFYAALVREKGNASNIIKDGKTRSSAPYLSAERRFTLKLC